MPIQYNNNAVDLTDVVGVDDAEELLQWFQTHEGRLVNLAECTHLHPANLQVLLAARSKVLAWPRNIELKSWLKSVLESSTGVK